MSLLWSCFFNILLHYKYYAPNGALIKQQRGNMFVITTKKVSKLRRRDILPPKKRERFFERLPIIVLSYSYPLINSWRIKRWR